MFICFLQIHDGGELFFRVVWILLKFSINIIGSIGSQTKNCVSRGKFVVLYVQCLHF
jgi:hypothetical protein